jgi:hypothetical protein
VAVLTLVKPAELLHTLNLPPVKLTTCVRSFRIVLPYITRHQTFQAHTVCDQWRTQEFFSGGRGVQKIQLRKEGRENGHVGALVP